MTVAFLPLALVTVPVENFQLFWVNVVFVAAMPTAYAAFLHWGSSEHGFKRLGVVILAGIYLLYVGVFAFWVLNLVQAWGREKHRISPLGKWELHGHQRRNDR